MGREPYTARSSSGHLPPDTGTLLPALDNAHDRRGDVQSITVELVDASWTPDASPASAVRQAVSRKVMPARPSSLRAWPPISGLAPTSKFLTRWLYPPVSDLFFSVSGG